MQYKFIDLFAGVGGTRLAFQKAGMQCVFSSEIDSFARATYFRNFGEEPFGDITKANSKIIPTYHILVAGFPCQPFSQAGLEKGFKDDRGSLFFDIVRILKGTKPDCFLLENVKKLKYQDNGRTFRLINKCLSGNVKTLFNYWVDSAVLNTKDFGLPQNRERIFIVGFNRKKYKNIDFSKIFNWPIPSHKVTKVEDILKKEVDSKYTISDRLWEGHLARKKKNVKRGYGFGFNLCKKEDLYTKTLSARYYKDGLEILIDQSHLNKRPRKLSPRECANLQGFPKSYKLDAVSNLQLYKQMGNSVSIPVVYAIAKQIKITLNQINEKKN